MIRDILAWSSFGVSYYIAYVVCQICFAGIVSILPIYTHLMRYLDWHTTVRDEDYGRKGSG